MSRHHAKGEKRTPVLQLVCACGRNIAGVSHQESNPDYTKDGLTVTENLGVDQTDYRPWHEANQAGRIGSPERAAVTVGREGVDWDMRSRTYSWPPCRCGLHIPPMRHDSISELWKLFEGRPYTRSAWRYVVNG